MYIYTLSTVGQLIIGSSIHNFSIVTESNYIYCVKSLGKAPPNWEYLYIWDSATCESKVVDCIWISLRICELALHNVVYLWHPAVIVPVKNMW